MDNLLKIVKARRRAVADHGRGLPGAPGVAVNRRFPGAAPGSPGGPGRASTSPGGPSSTTRPSASTATRVAKASGERHVVRGHEQRARPAAVSDASVAARSVRRAGSSEAVGSSISSSGGSVASARAMATRCASPPESSDGRASNRAPTPSESSRRRDRASASPRAMPSAWTCASDTFSTAVRCAKRWWNWKTMPTFRRSAPRCDSRGSGPGRSANPSTRISPASNGSSAADRAQHRRLAAAGQPHERDPFARR